MSGHQEDKEGSIHVIASILTNCAGIEGNRRTLG